MMNSFMMIILVIKKTRCGFWFMSDLHQNVIESGACDVLYVWAHHFCAGVQRQSYQLLSEVQLTLYTSSMMRMHWTLIFEVFLGFILSEKRNWQHLYVSGAVLRVSGDVLFMVFDKNASKEY